MFDIVVEQAALAAAVSAAAMVASKRSTLPFYRCVLLSARDGRLTVTAWSHVCCYRSRVDLVDCTDGDVAVDAADLLTRVTALPAGKVRLVAKPTSLEITSKVIKRRFAIQTVDSADAPVFPEPDSDVSITVAGTGLARVVGTVQHAAGLDETSAHLWGVLVDSDGEFLVASATDGKRGAQSTTTASGRASRAFIAVPALRPLLAMCGDSDVRIASNDKRITFDNGTETLSIGTVHEDPSAAKLFRVLSKKDAPAVEVKAAELVSAVKAIALSANEHNALSFRVADGEVTVKADGGISGSEASESIDCVTKSKPCEFSADGRLFAAGIGALKCERMSLHINGPLDPVIVRPTDGPDMIVVMPMRPKAS